MHIQFCGANKEVTGSCHLLRTKSTTILLECGMFEGSNFNAGRNFDEFPFDPKEIDAVVVSHAHMDHIGRIPKLIKDGFRGKIYGTRATCELAKIMWEDAYSIMTYDKKKFGLPVLYNRADISLAIDKCSGVRYHEKVKIGDMEVVFKDAGHIFGSAFVEVSAGNKIIGFSGDLGNVDVPILKDTEKLGKVDALICESTYGNRVHEDKQTRRSIVLQLIKDAASKGGTIMVPAFSLERSQEFLYELNMLSEYDHTLPKIPIFFDSPLAIKASDIMKRFPEYYDVDASFLHKMGDDFLDFPGLKLTKTKEESKRINKVRGPKMIIAGAGMMNGGRILHHAIRYLSDSKSTLIIVGYQAKGTLGRRIFDGMKTVDIFGQKVHIHCTVKAIGALSGHGDKRKIMSWISNAEKRPEKVFCVHGEPHGAEGLAESLQNELQIQAEIPDYSETVEI